MGMGIKSQKILEKLLVGREAKADHPITCLNPTETFIIKYVQIENDRIAVRGEETCWWGEGAWNLV